MVQLSTSSSGSESSLHVARFEAFRAASTALWDVAPFSLVEADRRFRGAYWLPRDYTSVLQPRKLSFSQYKRCLEMSLDYIIETICNIFSISECHEQCEISRSHGGEGVDVCVLGCNATP
jgi:hypothetical protein